MLGSEYAEKKYLSRILLRTWMDMDSVIELHVEYDSSGVWEYIGRMKQLSAGTMEFPLRLHRCDHVRVRISGQGAARIIGMTRELTEG